MIGRDPQNGVWIGEVPSLQYQKSTAALHRRQSCVSFPNTWRNPQEGKTSGLVLFFKSISVLSWSLWHHQHDIAVQQSDSVCTVRAQMWIHTHQLPTAYVWDWRQLNWAVGKAMVQDPFTLKEIWNTGLILSAPTSSLCLGNKLRSLLPHRKQLWVWLRKVLMLPAVRQMGTVALVHEYASNKQWEYTESNYP